VDNDKNILISLASRHAEKIFSGEKRVELRRRAIRVKPGATVWIYVKLPVGSIVGKAKVEAVHESSPQSLWRRFGVVSGLSKAEFFDYFSGVTQGFALVLEGARLLTRSVSLAALRKVAQGFQPPQFFTRLTDQHPLLRLVTDEKRQSLQAPCCINITISQA
jgi:predicted transcriptional regulator